MMEKFREAASSWRMFELAPDGVIVCALNGQVAYVNEAPPLQLSQAAKLGHANAAPTGGSISLPLVK